MLIKKILLTSLVIVLSNTATAAPVYLNKDEKAPYTGYLFNEDETKALRKELIDKDILAKLNESYKEENKYIKEALEIRNSQVKELLEDKMNEETRKYIYVAGGILATLLTVYVSTQVVKAAK